MTAQSDPFVRVYYSVMGDDPKFAQVYDDDARFACWVRLLLVADACYPAPAPIPAGIKKAALAFLVKVELVDLLPGSRYRIHGLQAERERRSERAAASARKRWSDANAVQAPDATAMRPHSERTAPHMRPNANPILSEPIRTEPSQSAARVPDDAYDVMLLVENLTRRPFNYRDGNNVHDTLVGDVAQHGAERMADEYRRFREGSGPVDAAQLVFGVHNALHPLIKAKPMTEAERKDAEIAAAIAQIKAETKAAAA